MRKIDLDISTCSINIEFVEAPILVEMLELVINH